uniref:Cadherin domain-containing protein n=1 Tax=Cairina moschata TaxID=8855 RepID=A0A8C3C295_CAIMO
LTEGEGREEPLPGRALFVILLLCVSGGSAETARYSVPEEAARGSLVGNIAKDLGLTAEELSTRQVRLVPEGEKQYFQLDQHTGDLFVREQMDGEEMCGQSEPCLVRFDVLLEGPLQSFRAEVSLTDINDHAPVFLNKEIILKISETTKPKARFLLESAQDPDVGNNSVHHYNISSNGYFHIYIRQRSDGRRHAELVLDRELDREKQAEVVFSITAVDGGSPPRSGTAVICVVVLDANDNIPVFTQSLYKVRVLENSSEDTLVAVVSAKDLDSGMNGEIAYSIVQNSEDNRETFKINSETGQIRLKKTLDYEEIKTYEIDVQATDGGGLSANCKVEVGVQDVNDNAPEVTITSLTSSLSEAAPLNTVVALFSVRDRDSGNNGRTSCELLGEQPFSILPLVGEAYALVTLENYYELVTVSTLDREETAQYLAVMTAADTGSPPLTTTQTFTVDISDVNDNAPVFNQTSYTMYVRENNIPGVLVGAVSAVDSDAGANAKVTYSLRPVHPTERDPCSCISVNSENGHVFVLRPLDYEQVRQLEVLVSATDAGSPPLSTNVTIRLLVVDENDNAPLVLHPAQDSSLPSSELVPALAEVGDLVTKVVAVDADSGQNSWLSFHLLRATDPGLFAVGSQNGEVRLRRPVTERDAVKQKLEVLVRDNGRPPLSATAALSVLLLNSLSQEHLRQQELAVQDEDSSLTIYLIISLVFVSLLFLTSVAAFVACKVCKRKELKGGDMPYGTGNLQSSVADGAAAGTLPHAYCYEINLTTGSGNSEFKFLKPILPSVPPQHSGTGRGVEYPFFLCHCFHSCLKVFLNEREVLSWSGFPGFC